MVRKSQPEEDGKEIPFDLSLFCLQAPAGESHASSDPEKGGIVSNPPKSGFSDNSIAAVAYFGPIPAFFFLAIRRYNKRPYVRFHSWQSLVLDAFLFLFFSFLKLVTPFAKFLGPRVLLGLWCVVCLAVFIVWVWCVVGALTGKRCRLPIIGDWADEQAYR